jgi:glycosyltransferase involved in cell wall biosynthesis
VIVDERLIFFVVATEWDSSNGGVSTFNRELCSSLAKLGHLVYCGVHTIAAGELDRAREAGVQLIMPTRVPGVTGIQSLTLPFEAARNIDIVIGHGRVTGSAARAQAAVHHREARHVHFVHTDARAIEPFKEREQEPMVRAEDYVNTEVEICMLADLVAAVGPVLQSAFSTYLNPQRKPVYCFLPGLFSCAVEAEPPPLPICLLFGRTEDEQLKGVGIAAKAMGEIGAMEDLGHARFVVRGAQVGDEADLRKRLMKAGGAKLSLFVEPYTSDRAVVLNSIRQASLVLMPSEEEGFGLSALEAISEGVPVLISKKSGLARALQQHVPGHAAAAIIEVPDGAKHLAKRIRPILVESEAAFERARTLREAMRPHFNWDQSACDFVEALRKGPSRPQPPMPPPTVPPPASATDALVSTFAAASSHVLAWQQTLRNGDEWIDRPELARVLEYARTGGEGPLVLLGAPGSGKSALLARAARALVDEKAVVLAIKADRLPTDVDSLEALAQEIGLPTDVQSALDAASQVRNTVLIIDQLDALADLVDVETQRLDVVLELVERVSKSDSVRIVMSCRAFDYEHDVRLRRLEADELKLSAPNPKGIDAVLVQRGVDPNLLSASTRDLLGTMQALDVFLQVTPAGRSQPGMDTYQKLLGALWDERLAGRPDRESLEESAERLAGKMAEREELWLSDAVITTLSGPPLRIKELRAAGILTQEDGRVAFSHQTLFEFARARHFLANQSSLPKFVRERQNALFVRPTLWTSLAYLRATDMQPYLHQLEELWLDRDLRAHIHRLLIDFVGQVEKPDIREMELLISGLREDKWRGVTIEAITGHPDWFEVVRRVELPTLMRSSNANMTTVLLAQAITFAPDAVAELMEGNWLTERARHLAIATVLFWAPAWPEKLQNLAASIVEVGALQRSTVDALIQGAISMSPPTASRIIALDFRNREAEVQPKADVADDETRRSAYQGLLESVGHIDLLVDVAAADPSGFVDAVWPWFVRILHKIVHPGDTIRYDEDYTLGASLESGFRELPQALQEALTICAKRAGFITEFVKNWQSDASMAVHRFLVLAIEASLPEGSQLALEYLLGDRRRLNIGDVSKSDDLSTWLIGAAAPLWTREDLQRIETSILNSSAIAPSYYKIEDRLYAYDVNRRHRLRLMRALGAHASDNVARLRREEERRFPSNDEAFDPNMRAIKSPVSAEQMLLAADEDILNLFVELPDATEHRHPSRRLEGGSSQAAEAFATAAKKEPDRFFRMLSQFIPGVSERPVLGALFSLAETEPLGRIEDAVVQLLELGFFRGSEERSQVAWAIERAARGGRVEDTVEISEKVRNTLESWLGEGDVPAPRPEPATEANKTDAMLGTAGGGSLPHGNYPILDALTTAYLGKAVPDFDGWMRILEAHVLRRENPDVWRALSVYLHNVLVVDSARAERFLNTLFARFPAVRDSRRGITIIVRAMGRLPSSTIARWMNEIEQGSWGRRSQAVGELLAWFATRLDAPTAARERLFHEVLNGQESFRRGLAQAAASLWHYPERRGLATDIIVALIPDATGSVGEALMSTFQLEPPLLDEAMQRILLALSEHPQVIFLDKSFGFVETLRDLLPAGADIVAPIVLSFVGFAATKPDQAYTHARSSELIDIAMTLQRLGNRFRDQGLDLFESLLAQNAYGVRDMLAELDPASRRTPTRAPRRVRRQSRRGRRRFN